MKNMTKIIPAVIIIGLGIAAFLLMQVPQEEILLAPGLTEGEITIRNVTKGFVNYSYALADSKVDGKKITLKPDAIHRLRSELPVDVTFERVGRVIVRRLFPGNPYSFRLDEENLLQVYEGSHGREDAVDLAPYVPTPQEVVEKMLEMAQVDADDILYDLGCGDGRIVITAAKKYGTRGLGIDIDPQRIRESKLGAKSAGVGKLVEFRLGDATRIDVSRATVVALYLLPESNELLRPRLDEQLKPGSYVVSHNYTIPGWEDKEVESASVTDAEEKTHNIYLYRR